MVSQKPNHFLLIISKSLSLLRLASQRSIRSKVCQFHIYATGNGCVKISRCQKTTSGTSNVTDFTVCCMRITNYKWKISKFVQHTYSLYQNTMRRIQHHTNIRFCGTVAKLKLIIYFWMLNVWHTHRIACFPSIVEADFAPDFFAFGKSDLMVFTQVAGLTLCEAFHSVEIFALDELYVLLNEWTIVLKPRINLPENNIG